MAVRYEYPNEVPVVVSNGVSFELKEITRYFPFTELHPIFAIKRFDYSNNPSDQIPYDYTICTITPVIPEEPYSEDFNFYSQETTDGQAELWFVNWEGTPYLLRRIGGYDPERIDNIFPTVQDYVYQGTSPIEFFDTWNEPSFYNVVTSGTLGRIPKWWKDRDRILSPEEPFFLHWWTADNSAKQELYELAIFDINNNAVFLRVSLEKPLVEILPNQCPDNTCAVDCDTHICCYGSDGIAVDYYIK